MTHKHEEASRLLRLAKQDSIAFSILAQDERACFATAAFHGQQAIEKALKSLLCQRGKDFPRTHDLEWLGSQLELAGFVLPVSMDALRRLTPYAVTFRYDEDELSLATAADVSCWVELTLTWAEGHLTGSGPDAQ